jgi:hypothetical protein
MVEMIEPTDPEERKLAIKICRVNCLLDPDTGLPEGNFERGSKLWKEELPDLAYAKWIWMWNHGRKEWDPKYNE